MTVHAWCARSAATPNALFHEMCSSRQPLTPPRYPHSSYCASICLRGPDSQSCFNGLLFAPSSYSWLTGFTCHKETSKRWRQWPHLSAHLLGTLTSQLTSPTLFLWVLSVFNLFLRRRNLHITCNIPSLRRQRPHDTADFNRNYTTWPGGEETQNQITSQLLGVRLNSGAMFLLCDPRAEHLLLRMCCQLDQCFCCGETAAVASCA